MLMTSGRLPLRERGSENAESYAVVREPCQGHPSPLYRSSPLRSLGRRDARPPPRRTRRRRLPWRRSSQPMPVKSTHPVRMTTMLITRAFPGPVPSNPPGLLRVGRTGVRTFQGLHPGLPNSCEGNRVLRRSVPLQRLRALGPKLWLRSCTVLHHYVHRPAMPFRATISRDMLCDAALHFCLLFSVCPRFAQKVHALVLLLHHLHIQFHYLFTSQCYSLHEHLARCLLSCGYVIYILYARQ